MKQFCRVIRHEFLEVEVCELLDHSQTHQMGETQNNNHYRERIYEQTSKKWSKKAHEDHY